jgi:hypothetical protein
MLLDNPSECIYISHVADDVSYAHRLRDLLDLPREMIATSSDSDPSGTADDSRLQFLRECGSIVVLVGPRTQLSRWVDSEIDIAITDRPKPAALLGIVLPHHKDFAKPYYEPCNVPRRLHDRVHHDYALMKKWTEDTEKIRGWLIEVSKRSQHLRSTVSSRAMLDLKKQNWDDTSDTPRLFLQSSSETP